MAEHAESWVKMRLAEDGTMTILEAPEHITIPLAWLTGGTPKRAEPYVTVDKDVISFHPTLGAPIQYKVNGINLTDKRFVGEKV